MRANAYTPHSAALFDLAQEPFVPSVPYTPPVNASWLVTVYDPDSSFVANPINRYALGSGI